jgi:hypothetical protein
MQFLTSQSVVSFGHNLTTTSCNLASVQLSSGAFVNVPFIQGVNSDEGQPSAQPRPNRYRRSICSRYRVLYRFACDVISNITTLYLNDPAVGILVLGMRPSAWTPSSAGRLRQHVHRHAATAEQPSVGLTACRATRTASTSLATSRPTSARRASKKSRLSWAMRPSHAANPFTAGLPPDTVVSYKALAKLMSRSSPSRMTQSPASER